MMTDLNRFAPVGVFDSGVGGISVLQHIHQHLPSESLIYIADNGHLPYGPKSSEFVARRAHLLADFLVEQGVKAIVVACNTATAAAVNDLRGKFSLPVIGIEPGVKPAISQSRTGIVGVLATEGTLGSEKFKRLVSDHGQSRQVIVQPCHGWVEQVEKGELSGRLTHELVTAAVDPLLQQGVDTLVLGCTHYPFLAAVVREVAGPDVAIVDTGKAIAHELERRLGMRQLQNDHAEPSEVKFWSSGDPSKIAPQIQRLWHASAVIRPLPELWC